MNLLPLLLLFSLNADAANVFHRPNDNNLTQEFAQARKGQVQSVDYNLKFTFDAKSTDFVGETIMDVTLTRIDQPLSIDFVGKKVLSVRVNDKVVKTISRRGSFDIPAKNLAKTNKITVAYIGSFSKDGYGPQRVVDPVDGAVYIYSDSEPYFAHLLFPSFDQPDLKGTFLVETVIPKDWIAISNDMISDTQSLGDTTRVRFNKSKPISPYLFFIGAGPFIEYKDKYEDIPLYLYARKTLAKYVDAPRWFSTTKKGLKFFGDYFGVKYPFPKYAHVFAPEFSWGGMENPGAVTINERTLFRGPMPQAAYEGRDDLILHEMAHMWFGDLVTMEWWDDLWLNESFASYMASVASEKTMKAQGALLGSIGGKGWAYWQDQLVTTHPIETKVVDTRTARGNFDGITYAKGSASLKQLQFFVDEDKEVFREGLKSYFQKFAFKNTRRSDFIGEIAKAGKIDLEPWTKAWLQTSGPNRVQMKWACMDGKISSFTVEQKPSSSGTLSPHKTRIGLYKAKGDGLKLDFVQDVVYKEASTSVASLEGRHCPQFVAPNMEDYDYALFALDEESKKYAKNVLTGAVPENTFRLQTWQMLAQMVRDRQLSVAEYYEMALPGLEKESDEALLAILLGSHSPVAGYYFGYLTPAERLALAPRFEAIVSQRLQKQKTGSNLQMTFFDFYTGIVQTADGQTRLAGMLNGTGLPKGFELDQDRRWSIIRTLSSLGYLGVKDLIAKEEARDPSNMGKRYAFASRAALPEKDAKKQFWKVLSKPEQIPYATLNAASRGFHNPNHLQLSSEFVKPFFQKVTTMNWKANDSLVDIYFEKVFPGQICTGELLKESERNLKAARNLTALSRRAWLEANDELSKCVSIRTQETKKRQL